MTVRPRRLAVLVSGFVAVGLVLGGLSVETLTGTQVTRAQRALPGALARAVLPEEADEAAVSSLAAARRHAHSARFASASSSLDQMVTLAPTATGHGLAALAALASDRGEAAARHAQLASRLAPDDTGLLGVADEAVDLALAYRLRPVTRPLTVLGGAFLLLLLAGSWLRRRERRRLEDFLESVTARIRLQADGERLSTPITLAPDARSLTIDILLSGRYGMACPRRRPRRAPSLHLTFSNASSSRTLRLRPIRRLTESAARVPLRPETLKRLLADPGRWRLHVRLGDRPLASVPVEIGSRQPLIAPPWRSNGAPATVATARW